MIPSNVLPSCLWRDDLLHPPSDVVAVYEAKLREMGILELALEHKGAYRGHGGVSEKDTYNHFAKRYLNSVTRLQCILLDPNKSFANIPRDLLVILTSHRISLLDLPCGAGAGAISVLGTLKELRTAGIIPTMPLTMQILGADISPHALEIYKDQLERIRPSLAETGITVNLETRLWDASDVQQTNELIDRYLDAYSPHDHFVLIANFSGASKSMFEHFKDSFRQIWIRLSGKSARSSTILWVEPEADAAKSLFKRLVDLVNPYTWFRRDLGTDRDQLSCKYDWFLRLQGRVISSGVMVHRYSRAK